MKGLRKYLLLTARERVALVEAAVLLATVRVGLRMLPFRTVLSLLSVLAQAPCRLRRGLSFLETDVRNRR